MGIVQNWIALLRLARNRMRSDADYHRFQGFQGNLIIEYMARHGIHIEDVRVLDLGCGKGGYSRTMTSAGARVVSLDLEMPLTELMPSNLVLADAMQLPFASDSFPLVFCASLIEHVPNPATLLAEIKRVLTGDGSAYLSFPPFYTPVGGHQFKPYHLLGERLALRVRGHRVGSFAESCGNWGLYPLSIRRARRLIAEADLRIRHESTRFLPVNLARLPWLGELLTWHVQFILCK